MMYNRYIPDAAGVYHPTRVGAEPQAAAPAPPPEPCLLYTSDAADEL